MKRLNPSTLLKESIRVLEIEQTGKAILLKEQFHISYESLKPVNLLKNTLEEITSSAPLIDNILGTTIGLASGYLSKKIVVGTSDNIFRKVFGSITQIGVAKIVAKHPDTIRSIGQFILHYLIHKKEADLN